MNDRSIAASDLTGAVRTRRARADFRLPHPLAPKVGPAKTGPTGPLATALPRPIHTRLDSQQQEFVPPVCFSIFIQC